MLLIVAESVQRMPRECGRRQHNVKVNYAMLSFEKQRVVRKCNVCVHK